jgi:nitroreductase
MTREVPRELIEDCLRVAMYAPIGSNGLYPHFVVVTDPAKRTALAGFYKQAWDAYLPLPFSAANLHFEDPRHEAQQAPTLSSWISAWPEPAADVLQPARAAQEANPLDSSVNRHLLPAGEDGDVARQRPATGACAPRTR